MTTAEFFSHHYQWMNKRGPLKVSTGLAMFAASAATKLAQMTGGVNEASTATVGSTMHQKLVQHRQGRASYWAGSRRLHLRMVYNALNNGLRPRD